MQTNEKLASRHAAELFWISDFRHKPEDFAGRYGRATSERKRKSNSVREGPLRFQQDTDGSQRDEEIFGSSAALPPALVQVPSVSAPDCTVLIPGEIGTGAELVAEPKVRKRGSW